MKKSSTLRQKIVAAVLAGTAFAIVTAVPYMPVSANDDCAPGNGTSVSANSPYHHQNPMKARIDQMVQNGKITQDQATSLESSLRDFHQQQRAKHQAFMNQLPDKTGISADTLKEIFPQRHHQGSRSENPMKQHIAQMVQNGKITQDQADKLESAMKEFHQTEGQKRMADHKTFMDQLPDKTGISKDTLKEVMAPPKHAAFMKQHIAQMVQNGKITQDQADKLENAMKKFHQTQRAEQKSFREQLPSKTGISADTLKEIFPPMQHHPMHPAQ